MKKLNNAARCEIFCWIIWTVYMIFIAVNPKCELVLFTEIELRLRALHGHNDTEKKIHVCFSLAFSRKNSVLITMGFKYTGWDNNSPK